MSLPSTPAMIKIVEKPKIIKQHYVQILVEQVELNLGAKCFVVTYDENRQTVDRQHIIITGDDYNRWIQDDDIIQIILDKLGMERETSS